MQFSKACSSDLWERDIETVGGEKKLNQLAIGKVQLSSQQGQQKLEIAVFDQSINSTVMWFHW